MNPLIDRIYALFAVHGSAHYGENISQLDHAVQCAQLAVEHNCPESLVAAALLHDIGRMIDPAGNDAELQGQDAAHEDIGAAWLAPAFPPVATEPIRLHVAAKRYLCGTEPSYAATLSAASLLSLGVQGGPMSQVEARAFEAEAFYADAVQLRRFDDWGKREGCAPAPLDAYRPLLERVSASVASPMRA